VLRYAQHLFDGGDARQGLADAVVAHAARTTVTRDPPEFLAACAADHRPPQFVVHLQQFDDAGAAEVARRRRARRTRTEQVDVTFRLVSAQDEIIDFLRRGGGALLRLPVPTT